MGRPLSIVILLIFSFLINLHISFEVNKFALWYRICHSVFNFTKTNIYDQVFNFNRALYYFFFLFILSLFVIYLLKNIFRNKNLLNISLFISFFWFYTFHYYLIGKFFEIQIEKIIDRKYDVWWDVGEISFIAYILLFISIF